MKQSKMDHPEKHWFQLQNCDSQCCKKCVMHHRYKVTLLDMRLVSPDSDYLGSINKSMGIRINYPLGNKIAIGRDPP